MSLMKYSPRTWYDIQKRGCFSENIEKRGSHLPDSYAVSMRTFKTDGNQSGGHIRF
ncbi:hypothetical protein S101441_01049 [Bacillus subtilis subsp. subtilis]|uniref:hypothetical protein n=1 Tax=Bacillus subtilis TaxID=1423 RepID=UPI000B5837BE|nr:hypothetical protein [Bacillus subtilis]ARW30600.1 hypothetical protein S101441_01049 [Bacillus subtilis subsp. subtilis]